MAETREHFIKGTVRGPDKAQTASLSELSATPSVMFGRKYRGRETLHPRRF